MSKAVVAEMINLFTKVQRLKHLVKHISALYSSIMDRSADADIARYQRILIEIDSLSDRIFTRITSIDSSNTATLHAIKDGDVDDDITEEIRSISTEFDNALIASGAAKPE